MKFTTKEITLTAVFLALVFVITRFIQIPIPLGYFNIGNSIIMISCLFLPMPGVVLAGSLGSALADLTSFPVYTIPTLIIKFLFPLVFCLIYKIKPKHLGITILAAAVSTLIPLVGYTITGGILYGGFYAGLAQLPGLALEYVANLIIFTVIFIAIRKTPIVK